MDSTNCVDEKKIDPASILRAAVEQIDVFTKLDVVSLGVKENGRLVPIQVHGLERIVGLARNFIGPIFFGQERQKQEKKLGRMKRELLRARDTIQSHSLLIEKLREGDSTQQNLAHSVLEAINRYNKIVVRNSRRPDWTSNYDFYNYERSRLLSDEEIKGKEIRLPHQVSIKLESHPNSSKAQATIKKLSETLVSGVSCGKSLSVASVHKKGMQVMVDAFQMKAIRKIQEYLQAFSMCEILQLVKETSIVIHEEPGLGSVSMRQIIEISPGSFILLSGSFKKIGSDSKLMGFPIMEEFHSSLQSTQTGFPYPSQYAAWALANQLIDADPLRMEQVPLFARLEKRKKNIAQGLLFNHGLISKAKSHFKQTEEVFNLNAEKMIGLHRELFEMIIRHARSVSMNESTALLNNFYDFISASNPEGPSSFERLVGTQLQIIHLAITRPHKKLQEEWLNGYLPLREGSYQLKLQAAAQILQDERECALASIENLPNVHSQRSPIHPFIRMMVRVIGEASQSIILQYMSEKMGFTPPMLNDFEQKMQACAFQQLLTFLDELEGKRQPELKGLNNADERKKHLEVKFRADIAIFESEGVDSLSGLASELTHELEVYFNSRFYAADHRNT